MAEILKLGITLLLAFSGTAVAISSPMQRNYTNLEIEYLIASRLEWV